MGPGNQHASAGRLACEVHVAQGETPKGLNIRQCQLVEWASALLTKCQKWVVRGW